VAIRVAVGSSRKSLPDQPIKRPAPAGDANGAWLCSGVLL